MLDHLRTLALAAGSQLAPAPPCVLTCLLSKVISSIFACLSPSLRADFARCTASDRVNFRLTLVHFLLFSETQDWYFKGTFPIQVDTTEATWESLEMGISWIVRGHIRWENRPNSRYYSFNLPESAVLSTLRPLMVSSLSCPLWAESFTSTLNHLPKLFTRN